MADEYYRGASVRLTASVTDTDGTAASPTVSMVVRVMDPNGTRQVDDKAATELATGSYEYVYDTAADADLGEWTYEYIATDGAGSDVTIAGGTFHLIKREA